MILNKGEMKILLFGRSGQIGRAILASLPASAQVIAPGWRAGPAGSNHEATTSAPPRERWLADFQDPAQLYERTLALAPDVIINAAAYTAVDEAEDNETAAMLINAHAPAALAQAAVRCGALLIHFSSDYVFDGSGTRPWRESDQGCPCNVYGQSKLAADLAIMGSGCRHLIWRTSWVYASAGNGFLQTIMRLARTRQTLSVVNDQIGAPTDARLLAAITLDVLERYGRHPEHLEDGLYHVAAAGQTSWFDYANRILVRMRARGVTLALERLLPVSSQDYGSRARRPLNSRLDTARFLRTFALPLPAWQAGVDAAVDRLCEDGMRDQP